MGELIFIFNHTTKEWIDPDCSKWGEILLNRYIMEGILDILHGRWNNCKIEFVGEYSRKLHNLWDSYKEIKIDFNDYRE